ncbi:X-box-binding protein 1 [Lucilia cuprina]|nr:X-box-binding protein 1 [Lucilia cuprina]
MSTQPTVFITVPKYVAITPIQAAGTAVTTVGSTATTVLPKIRPAPPTQTPVAEQKNETTNETQAPKGKKRRLDHLTWEEKVQRKKLKNRVAAQTSRDRKKARMEEMEHEIEDLTEKTQILVNKCESLQVINDSLLEKNQKLDMEVEILRQQLQELQKQQQLHQQQQQQLQQQQQQHKTVTCAGCESLLNGSAVSNNTDPLPQGSNHKDSQSSQETLSVLKLKQQLKKSATVSSLPSLQDMLLPDIEIDEGALDDAEFDAGKLEELAESLLADITADLEASDRACNAPVAETSSGTERLFGSMVGSTTECLESGQHKISYNGSCLEAIATETTTTTTPNTNQSISNHHNSLQTPELTLENKFEKETTTALQTPTTLNTTTALITTVLPDNSATATVTPDTVYGTYDAKTNSITIVMDDVAVPVSEAVEEIYCDGVAASSSTDEVVCSSGMASPSQVYLNVATCSDDDEDEDDDVNFNLDPIEKFLCPKRPLVSPLAKSPAPSLHSATSDHGYESIIGSPSPPSHHFEPLSEDLSDDDFSTWPAGFNELFPSLI